MVRVKHPLPTALFAAFSLHVMMLPLLTLTSGSVTPPAQPLALQLNAARMQPTAAAGIPAPRIRAPAAAATPAPSASATVMVASVDAGPAAITHADPPSQASAEAAATGTATATPSFSGVTAAATVEARVDTAYLDNPKPRYPPLSRRLGEQGTALLRVDVGADGEVIQAALERSSGFTRLDEAARSAVTGWRFLPARRGDQPLASTVLVPVSFGLAAADRPAGQPPAP